jgi:hypothetical protein
MRAGQHLARAVGFESHTSLESHASHVSLAALVGLLALAGCDDPKPKGGADKSSDASITAALPATAATPAATPAKPSPITVEAGAFALGPERVMASDPDPVGRLVGFLSARPDVTGAVVDFEARRAAKPSLVVTMLTALKKAKAKGAVVHTETREKTMSALELKFLSAQPEGCTTVAFIGKDGGILVWPAGGGTAKRFSRGFAGPDMTLGTEGVRVAASRCESPVLLVGADDAMSWGLVYDLAAMSKSGGTLKPTEVALVPGGSATVAGRKVTVD